MKETNERLDNLNRIITVLELQGVDFNQPFLYGYFFVDKNLEKLDKLSTKLAKKGFSKVTIEKRDSELYFLHLEKIESHTQESLLERLNEFDQLAKDETIELFDGWDVGHVDISKPLVSEEQFKNKMQTIDVNDLHNYANVLLKNGIYERAISVFDECIKNNIEVKNSLYKQFICFDYLGEPENVIWKLKEVLKINPNHFKSCYNIGAVSYDLENFDESIEFYEKAAKINSNDDSVFYGIALSQYCLGNMVEAEFNCKKALSLNKNNENAGQLLTIMSNNK